MNLSRAISSIIQSYGLYGITLPFKDENGNTKPTETVIHDVLKTTTIPIYSQYVPWERSGLYNICDLKCIDKEYGIYMMPPMLTLTPILYVMNVRLPHLNTRGTFGDVSPAYGINRSVEGVITATEYMMLAGQMRAEPTFEYLGNNKIKLYGYPRTVLEFIVACEHEPNGETIKDTCYDSFMELAKLDVKMFLYSTLKLYNEIPTAFGTINLKLDDYASAEGDRTQLLNEWRDRFHLDLPFNYFM